MSRRNLSIIIVPHDGKHSRTIKTSYLYVKGVLVTVFLCLAVVAGVAVHYGILLEQSEEMEGLRAENRLLEEKVSLIDELSIKLKEYEIYVEKINVILGVAPSGDGSEMDSEESQQVVTTMRAGEASYGEDRAPLISHPGSEVPAEWPLTRHGFITRGFIEESLFHLGIDIAVPENTPVRATASGVIVELGWDNDYGNYVEVEHGGGYATLYGHNSRLIVNRGQWVRKGEIVAFSGSTGRSTAPHLHYEVRRRGVAVDPQPYLLGYHRDNGVGG